MEVGLSNKEHCQQEKEKKIHGLCMQDSRHPNRRNLARSEPAS